MKNMTLSLQEEQIEWLRKQENASATVRELLGRVIRGARAKEDGLQLDIPTIEAELGEESALQKEINAWRDIPHDTRMNIRDIYKKENPGKDVFGVEGIKKCIEIAKRERVL